MSSHEAPAQVADFFSTIEEAGIADIAAEVGIIPDSGTAISPPRASSLPPLDESVQPSYLTSHGGGSSSNGAGSSIMPGPGSANPPASPALRPPPLLLHLPARFAQCFILVLSTEQGHRRGGNVLRAHVIFGAASPRRACQHAHRGRRACGEEEADAEDSRRQGGRQGAGGRPPPPPATLLLPPNLPPNPHPNPLPSPPPDLLLALRLSLRPTLLLHLPSPPLPPPPHPIASPPPALPSLTRG